MNLTVTAVPKPVFTSVANAASYVSGAVSPGENIVIFGTGLGPATLALGHITNNAYDTTLSNTRVLFDGTPAPIIYASAGQTSVTARMTQPVTAEEIGAMPMKMNMNSAMPRPSIAGAM